jgi:hypothetical protein
MNDQQPQPIADEQPYSQELRDATLKRYPILKLLEYRHLSPPLQDVSKPFGDLAWKLALELPQNAETSTALRKLREAKDCAVGALLVEKAQ